MITNTYTRVENDVQQDRVGASSPSSPFSVFNYNKSGPISAFSSSWGDSGKRNPYSSGNTDNGFVSSEVNSIRRGLLDDTYSAPVVKPSMDLGNPVYSFKSVVKNKKVWEICNIRISPTHYDASGEHRVEYIPKNSDYVTTRFQPWIVRDEDGEINDGASDYSSKRNILYQYDQRVIFQGWSRKPVFSNYSHVGRFSTLLPDDNQPGGYELYNCFTFQFAPPIKDNQSSFFYYNTLNPVKILAQTYSANYYNPYFVHVPNFSKCLVMKRGLFSTTPFLRVEKDINRQIGLSIPDFSAISVGETAEASLFNIMNLEDDPNITFSSDGGLPVPIATERGLTANVDDSLMRRWLRFNDFRTVDFGARNQFPGDFKKRIIDYSFKEGSVTDEEQTIMDSYLFIPLLIKGAMEFRANYPPHFYDSPGGYINRVDKYRTIDSDWNPYLWNRDRPAVEPDDHIFVPDVYATQYALCEMKYPRHVKRRHGLQLPTSYDRYHDLKMQGQSPEWAAALAGEQSGTNLSSYYNSESWGQGNNVKSSLTFDIDTE